MIQEGTYSENTNRSEETKVDPSAGPPSIDAPADDGSDAGSTEGETTEADATTQPERELPLDITFEILKNSRRRTVLEYLRDEDDTVTIGELAEHIAAIENDTTVQQLNAQQRKRVYIGLYQCHLPKMDDANVVDFNQDRGLVTITDAAAPLFDYLDTVEESSTTNPPHRYFAFTAVTGIGFLIAQIAGAYTIASVVVLGYLALLTGYMVQTYTEQETD